MIATHGGVEVYAWCEPADMRKGFEGLAALVRNEMGYDVLNGALFLFVNKARNRAKVLHFDGTGLCVYAKRLERKRFVALWVIAKGNSIPLSKQELELFLQGSHLIGRFHVGPAPMTKKELEVSL